MIKTQHLGAKGVSGRAGRGRVFGVVFWSNPSAKSGGRVGSGRVGPGRVANFLPTQLQSRFAAKIAQKPKVDGKNNILAKNQTRPPDFSMGFDQKTIPKTDPGHPIFAAKRLCSWVGVTFATRPGPTRPDPARPPDFSMGFDQKTTPKTDPATRF